MVALRRPAALGLKETWKVVEPPTGTVVADAVTPKSAAWVPMMLMGVLIVSGPEPTLRMVKVRTTDDEPVTLLPKAVSSLGFATVAPSEMSVPLP